MKTLCPQVTADTEKRELVTRETMVKASDKTTVIGTAQLTAGAVQHIAAGDYAVATGRNRRQQSAAMMKRRLLASRPQPPAKV